MRLASPLLAARALIKAEPAKEGRSSARHNPGQLFKQGLLRASPAAVIKIAAGANLIAAAVTGAELFLCKNKAPAAEPSKNTEIVIVEAYALLPTARKPSLARIISRASDTTPQLKAIKIAP